MIIAVQLQITIVSTNTPRAWTNPAFTGLSHSAAAAARGAEPLPPHWKKASFYSVHQHDAKSAGNSLTKSESFFKDPFKYSRHTSKICKYNKQRDHKIKHCHYRHQKIQNFNRCILPKHDHSCDHYQHDGSIQRRNIKSIFERRRDGIADNLTDPTPADQAGNGKQNGKQNLFRFLPCFSSQ